jgi:hypothetical protein
MSLHLRSSISDPQFAHVRINRFGSGCSGAGGTSRGVGEGGVAAVIGPRIERPARGLHRFRAGGEPMERDRTRDSIEQVEDAQHLPNPITDDDATLGEVGDAAVQEGEEPERDKDRAEGPAPHTTQMPR